MNLIQFDQKDSSLSVSQHLHLYPTVLPNCSSGTTNPQVIAGQMHNFHLSTCLHLDLDSVRKENSTGDLNSLKNLKIPDAVSCIFEVLNIFQNKRSNLEVLVSLSLAYSFKYFESMGVKPH